MFASAVNVPTNWVVAVALVWGLGQLTVWLHNGLAAVVAWRQLTDRPPEPAAAERPVTQAELHERVAEVEVYARDNIHRLRDLLQPMGVSLAVVGEKLKSLTEQIAQLRDELAARGRKE